MNLSEDRRQISKIENSPLKNQADGQPKQGRIQGGVLGVKTPPFLGKYFQFARVFKEKNPNPPLIFSSIQKNFKTPPSKNFWIRPRA